MLSFLSEKLAEIGVDVYFQTAVGDNEARLLSLLEIASQRSSLVILTGGLGPTEDDLTKQTLAKFFRERISLRSSGSGEVRCLFRPETRLCPNTE